MKKEAKRYAITDAVADRIYVSILQKLLVERRYRDPNYTEAMLSREIRCSARYITQVLKDRTGGSYSQFVNSYRLRDARRMLRTPRYADYTVEEIGIECGYASRQAFYVAFGRDMGMTPRQYRKMNHEE
ncbi:MAG: helix-turn-helix transcriptional regulator [Alloprevotella sp.]|nr:helix-turn-helix transcriptional regulator [Alloprevotella sp.]